jgi:superfamily II DNA or RNA helicase
MVPFSPLREKRALYPRVMIMLATGVGKRLIAASAIWSYHLSY